MANFKPTKTTDFWFTNEGIKDHVIVEIQEGDTTLAWRLVVNKERSPVFSDYSGIPNFKGYFIATAYWKGTFPEMHPFRIEKASLK
jgi:hypothetical protein